MNKNFFLNQLEDILEIERNSLTGSEPLSKFDGWDSLAIIQLIAMLDSNNITAPSANVINDFKFVNDIFNCIEN